MTSHGMSQLLHRLYGGHHRKSPRPGVVGLRTQMAMKMADAMGFAPDHLTSVLGWDDPPNS